jgi:hypothetical protein
MMSDSDSTPPKTPEISAVIFGYVNVQLTLFVAFIYGMKNVEPWPYGVSRCDSAYLLFIAGFLTTAFLILINYTEGQAEKIKKRKRFGLTSVFIARVILIPGFLFGAYFIVIHGLHDFFEKFF